MKKVKIMLLAVLVVGSVGGVLAFKAKSGVNLYCGPTPSICQDFTNKWTFTNVDPVTTSFCDVTSHNEEPNKCLPVKTDD
jgi:hypothetical protein